MSERNVQLRRVASVVGLLIVAGGCASSAQQRAARSQFERAQAAYQQAEADPNVQMYAQGRLADAQKTLREAEQAKHSDERLHLSYLAEKKALLASVTGATGKTEQNMEQLRRETSDVLLQKRDRELKAARTESDTKAREAEQWRRLAEARTKDDEAKARTARPTDDAEAKALAAEQAKARGPRERAGEPQGAAHRSRDGAHGRRRAVLRRAGPKSDPARSEASTSWPSFSGRTPSATC